MKKARLHFPAILASWKSRSAATGPELLPMMKSRTSPMWPRMAASTPWIANICPIIWAISSGMRIHPSRRYPPWSRCCMPAKSRPRAARPSSPISARPGMRFQRKCRPGSTAWSVSTAWPIPARPWATTPRRNFWLRKRRKYHRCPRPWCRPIPARAARRSMPAHMSRASLAWRGRKAMPYWRCCANRQPRRTCNIIMTGRPAIW